MKRAIWIAALAALAASVFAQVDPNKTVATVNGEVIKGSEYYSRMERLSGVGRMANGRYFEFPPGFMTLDQLITERLILQLAKEKGVLPTDPEIKAELAWRVEENPKLLEGWLNSGRTQAELEYDLKVELARFKIITQGITVTDQEVEQFYKQYPSTFTLAKKLKLRVIAISDGTKRATIDQALSSGKTFAEVAKLHSEDITKSIGGELGEIFINALSPAVQSALNNTKIGQTTPWLEAQQGSYVKFLLENATPQKLLPLDTNLKRSIRRKLMMDKGRVKGLDIDKEMFALRTKAIIDIKDKAFADAYAKYIEAYKKDTAIKSGSGSGN